MRFNHQSSHRHRMPYIECKGYKVAACWRCAIDEATKLCPSCQKQKNKDEFKEFLTHIPLFTDEMILERLRSSAIYLNLRDTYQTGSMDDFLLAVFNKSRRLLHRVLDFINSTPLKATLLLRVRNHTRTYLCRVYGYMLRNHLFDDNIIPGNCLQCCGHLVLYGMEGRHDRHLALTSLMWEPNLFQNLIRSTLLMPEAEWRLAHFYRALAYREEHTLMIAFEGALQNTRVRNAIQHYASLQPATWLWGLPAQNFVKRRIQPYLEELMAKSWHTSRMPYWCLDEEEKKCFGEFDPAPPLTGGPAEWNIPWGKEE